MNFAKNSSILVAGTVLVAAGLVLSSWGRGTPLVSTYFAITALLLTFMTIWVNVYRNASAARTMGRILHDDPNKGVAGPRSAAASGTGSL